MSFSSHDISLFDSTEYGRKIKVDIPVSPSVHVFEEHINFY